MSFSEFWLWAAVLLLGAHILLDLRSLVEKLQHPKDALLTGATLVVLVLHIITDFWSP